MRMRSFWVAVAGLYLLPDIGLALFTQKAGSVYKYGPLLSSISKAHAQEGNDGTLPVSLHRRRLCSAVVSSLFLPTLPAQAAESFSSAATPSDLRISQADSATFQTGMLETRVTENLLSPPPYGMESPDVFYPSWFAGTWNADSVCTQVETPCGIALFGGNRTLLKAQKEIGTPLRYESRFITATTADQPVVIADREFNVKSIAKAAMGANSVVDVPLASPNKFSCVLSLVGSPTLLRVDLFTLNRRQESISDTQFHCSEVVREIVAPVGPQAASTPTNPILKEVETTSLYTFDPNAKAPILCRQRSATFLLPSQSNELQMRLYAASRGRPVDVRFYDVSYTKR